MTTTPGFAAIDTALAALLAGRPVLVLDDVDRENEGDVVLAGATLTKEWLAWTIRHTSGYICAPMTPERADALDLPLMVADNQDPRRTAYTVTVDARSGISTGISAADRSRTIRLLADARSGPTDFTRPGHVVPLRARDGGVLARAGHTEATVDLCRLAGLPQVGAIGELVRDDGSMMRTPQVLGLGAEYDLPVITIADLVAFRERHDRVERAATTRMPTEHGSFELVGYRDKVTGAEHIALLSPRGVHAGSADGLNPQVRVHSECLTGDVFGSLRCDCGPQLVQSMATVARDGGAVVYLRGHEGRGVGLLAKLAAYRLQDSGVDTVDAQTVLGLPVDDREYGAAAAILRDLGIDALTLMTNNPLKAEALRAGGLTVTQVPLRITPNPANEFYLRTKRDRLGHDILIQASVATLGTSHGED
ncbi:MAG TPA: 3,4-dihydroxy-2-butanone-4-phosphate synthase [Dermatophilaceae bacterium]|nr:3,4-dihydroxy-2-butanone-4-phosphate synthase [Dermatophilaceae bacterium]